MPAELIEAYKSTRYEVEDGGQVFILSIGSSSMELVTLYEKYGVDSCAFITAYNPYSKPCSVANNASNQSKLAEKLAAYAVLRGSGKDPADVWPAEPGFLILGISAADAVVIGKTFQQNAIIVCGVDGVPALRLLR